MTHSPQRGLPSVEKAVLELGPLDIPRPLVVAAVRRELAVLRSCPVIPPSDEIMIRLRRRVDALRASRLQPVINATGIPLHTNFGRAPLSAAAVAAISAVAGGYSNLEYDLDKGARGGRGAYLEQALALLCEAEAATVVNNCAGALVLILRRLTAEKPRVIISRGELIQIGGGFRIPGILEAAGATLCEVGTTNRTTLEDYASALGAETALILKVHRSNFYMEGFVESPPTSAIAQLAARAGVPLVEDLGSGAVADVAGIAGLQREPSPAQVLAQGVDLVCFSGDKLFGGPQAGIIAGRAALVRDLKEHPLFRAFRCDKLVFAALQATAEAHLSGAALADIPALAMLSAGTAHLAARAGRVVASLEGASVTAGVVEVEAEPGAGTLPRSRVPSVAIALIPGNGSLEELAARLRKASPPVIGYISDNRLLLDLRTVFAGDDAHLAAAIRHAVEIR
jgi:L-seryl-tRNA(Ser) seleniumtransferase